MERPTTHCAFIVVIRLVLLFTAASSSTGHAASAYTSGPLSADGRYVVFSTEKALVPNDGNGREDVYRYDRLTGRVLLVSVNQDNTGSGDAESFSPAISADGSVVAFVSNAGNLSAQDGNGTTDVFVRDLSTEITVLASVNRTGTNSGNGRSFRAQLSADGRFIAFESEATDLVAMNDANGESHDVFVRDRVTDVTTLISVNQTGTGSGNLGSILGAISADGRVVVFVSNASDLTADDSNTSRDIFARDLAAGTTTLVSANRTGTAGGNADSFDPVVNSDGTIVAYGSSASDLVASDNNGADDIFVRDLSGGVTELVSLNRDETGSGNGGSFAPKLSADGAVVAFVSGAEDLVTGDGNGNLDVFVRDRLARMTLLASENRAATGGGNGRSDGVALSANGAVVAFVSTANDLTTNAVDGLPNLFVRNLVFPPRARLVWEPSTTPDVTYLLYAHTNTIGQNLAVPIVRVDAGTNLTAIANVTPGTWHFVVTARKDDLESEPSDEVETEISWPAAALTRLASATTSGAGSGNDPAYFHDPQLSGEAGVLAFHSFATNLIADRVAGSGELFLFSVDSAPPTQPPPASAFVGSGGLVVMEAEHFETSTATPTHWWASRTDQAGFVGASFLRAIPNVGTLLETNVPATSPTLSYRVEFTSTGTYNFWVRGWGDSLSDDSVYLGVDGQVLQPLHYNQTNAWMWRAKPIVITTPGQHAINLWMREDGACVDRLLLAADLAFTPEGDGPPESNRFPASRPPLILGYSVSGSIIELSHPSDGLPFVEFSHDLSNWAALGALTNVSLETEQTAGVMKTRVLLQENTPLPLFFRVVRPQP